MVDAVIQRLRLAVEGDQPLLAHPRQMLRQRRLAQGDLRLQFANAHLARLQQQTQHQQAVFIGKGAQPLRRFCRTFGVELRLLV